jgi:hypothetical protein
MTVVDASLMYVDVPAQRVAADVHSVLEEPN